MPPTLRLRLARQRGQRAGHLAELVPTDPDEPLPLPAAPARGPVADPVPALARLAAEHAGRAVTLRLSRAGHTVYRHDDDRLRPLAPSAGPVAADEVFRVEDFRKW